MDSMFSVRRNFLLPYRGGSAAVQKTENAHEHTDLRLLLH